MDRKKTLTKSIEEFAGCAFVSKRTLAKYLGRSRARLDGVLEGVFYLETKRERRYFVPEIAESLIRNNVL